MLNLSQSAVSRHISSLEEELKTQLFRRHARGIALTEQGEILLNETRDIFSKMESVRSLLLDSRNMPSGEIRLAATISFGTIWLLPHLREFMTLYPDIKVRLILRDEPVDFAMRQTDVALRLAPPTQPDLIQRKLRSVHLSIYGSPEYLQKYGVPKQASDLDHHQIITFGSVESHYSKNINILETIGRPEGQPRIPVLCINNILALHAAVEHGVGLATLPDYLIPDHSPLIKLLPHIELPVFDFRFVYPQELRSSKKLIVLKDFLVEKIRDEKAKASRDELDKDGIAKTSDPDKVRDCI